MDIWYDVATHWWRLKRRASLIELGAHQQKAVDELKNGNILWGGVGSGKSRAAMAYFYSKVCGGVYGDRGSLRRPKDLYIITTAKKRDSLDWEEEANRFVISRDRSSSVSNIQLTVDSWNNIGKYEEIEDAFFIFDEQRLVGSGAWVKSFLKISKSNQWIMLSATPGDTWLDYIPVFVANGFYKNRTEFKREHVVYNTYSKFPKVDRYTGVGKLVRLRNQILVEMPYERHTVRHIQDVPVDYDHELFQKVVKKRWHVYEDRPLKDVAELFRVMRKVVNTDFSRQEAVRTLLRTHPKVIVFYNFDYELEMLRSLRTGSKPESSTSMKTEWKQEVSKSPTTSTRSSLTDSERTSASEKCGIRAEYMKGHTGLCVLKPHGPETEHLIEMVTPDLPSTDYSGSGKAAKSTTQSKSESGSHSGTSSLSSSVSRYSEEKDPSGVEPREPRWTTSKDTSIGESSFAVAEWNGHKHEPIPKTDRWLYLVQYVAGAEGWNCIETDAMIFFSLTYSYKNFHQAQGRIDRLNTPFTDLWYYVLRSNSMIDKAIWKALSSKRDFNERAYVDRMG